MKILLLGATGRTGKLLLSQALDKGHEVHCLSRNIQRLPQHPQLTPFEGDPSKKGDLEKAIIGCQAILSVLNISRTSDFPWAKLRTPKLFLSDTMQQLLPLAKSHAVERVIICSAWGVAETRKDIPGWFRWFIDNSNIGVAYQDHERQEALLEASNLGWTIIRPVGLTNSKRAQSIRTTLYNQPKPSLTVSRLSVAKFILDSLKQADLIGKKVVISKA
ncbi:MAG: NAD(P)-binding oxidoreductase [Bacteroidota bacterium]